jgi:type II secretory pathway component PulF
MVIPHAVLRSVHIALAVQIRSGSTPLNAVNSIMQSMRHRGAKAVLRLLRDRLLEADSLSKAMGFFPRIWPKNVRAVLDAVEQRSPDSFAKQLTKSSHRRRDERS